MKNVLLEEGDVIEINKTHTVYADVPEHFIFDNRKGIFDLTHRCINIKDFDYLAGKYIVYKTCTDGGGTGHGRYDIYPDPYISQVLLKLRGEKLIWYLLFHFTKK